MQTRYLSAADTATPRIAAELIKNGDLVAIPTETVYGLGAGCGSKDLYSQGPTPG